MSDRIVRLIGLTGGIATGKTAISNYLADTYKFPILDADIYAREAVHPGTPILNSIRERYGASILLSDGNLNRPELGNIIFCNPTERQWLEQQIHPYVRHRLVEATQSYIAQLSLVSTNTLTLVLVVPLLFEANMTDLCTEIWVVYCSPSVQLERLMHRDGLSCDRANARIDTQLPLNQKCQKADVVLDNSSTLQSLLSQVDSKLN
ncbi:MAG: dephospho-CoA kinase [Tychonema bourrellyi B0820]|uniref:Dephospho-CoA kinase n=1 Tax=Tychonema bourrellyi FEM_GT703 TaxID=2040638 RepID=A0A2G4EY20_9CYAN|nr:dephospho-CoA kinase [Tychonema bourrellyi]MDQ2098643.1 dephospho-CoA kinase [Tychonema bourrellyi B0820]PHX54435.1 dephospho-CoA kinase [Tychonema bourrellyi FEM_GT703]